MFIVCPKCKTKYSIAASLISVSPTNVHCTKCGNDWLVKKHEAPVQPEPVVVPKVVPEDTLKVTQEAPAVLTTEETTEEKPVDEEKNIPMDNEAVDEQEDVISDETPDDASGGLDTFMQGEIDVLADIIEEEEEEEEEEISIPEMFVSQKFEDKAEEKFKISPITIKIACALLSFLIVLWLGRYQIVKIIPAMLPVYETLGIEAEVIGEGLAFRNPSRKMIVKDYEDILVVRGFVLNISDETKIVPMLSLVLYDEFGIQVLEKVVAFQSKELLSGISASFSIIVPSPPKIAKKMEITFTKKGKTGSSSVEVVKEVAPDKKKTKKIKPNKKNRRKIRRKKSKKSQ